MPQAPWRLALFAKNRLFPSRFPHSCIFVFSRGEKWLFRLSPPEIPSVSIGVHPWLPPSIPPARRGVLA